MTILHLAAANRMPEQMTRRTCKCLIFVKMGDELNLLRPRLGVFQILRIYMIYIYENKEAAIFWLISASGGRLKQRLCIFCLFSTGNIYLYLSTLVFGKIFSSIVPIAYGYFVWKEKQSLQKQIRAFCFCNIKPDAKNWDWEKISTISVQNFLKISANRELTFLIDFVQGGW